MGKLRAYTNSVYQAFLPALETPGNEANVCHTGNKLMDVYMLKTLNIKVVKIFGFTVLPTRRESLGMRLVATYKENDSQTVLESKHVIMCVYVCVFLCVSVLLCTAHMCR